MSVTTSETGTLGLHSLENYAPLIGAAAVERISKGSASSTAAVSARHLSAGLPPNEWLETMSKIITRWPAGLQSQL